jgi:hypothetical protein
VRRGSPSLVEILTEDFCVEAIEAWNADPDAAQASVGWTFDFGLVVDRPAGALALYLGAPSSAGRLPRPEFLSAGELERRAPQYFARADEVTWIALLRGALDPVAAVVQRRLLVRGDLAPVAARLQYRGLALRWCAQLAQRLSFH